MKILLGTLLQWSLRNGFTFLFFRTLYFNILKATLRDKYDNINEIDISKGVAKFILNFGGTEIVKPVDVSV